MTVEIGPRVSGPVVGADIELPAPARAAAPTVTTAPVAALSAPPSKVGREVPAASVSAAISTARTRIAESLTSPFGPAVDSPINWLMLAFTRQRTRPAAVGLDGTQTPASPVLVLNGYNVVAASKLDAVSFYGPKSAWPGYPGIQGAQNFDLTDPNTGETVGSFTAHVRLDANTRTALLQVTETRSGTVGTDPGNTPPVGSVISVSGQGTKVTRVYSDMPSPDGYVLNYQRITPFRTVPLRTGYHAAYLHTDYRAVNKPLDLLNGFTIAPQAPDTEVFTTITGIPPIFTAVQGTQSFSVYDKNNLPVGDFTGLVTTTSDFSTLNTKMIVVTDTGDQTNVGIGPGQIPPVGTVYNVIYFTPKFYVLYQSSPTPSGDYVSTKLVTKSAVIPLKIGNLDASTPPPLADIPLPGGQTFVPRTSGPIIGVDGLPPRDMITQGYEQFDVLDTTGAKVGSYDAYLTTGWQGMKSHIRQIEILVVKVTEGVPGTGVAQIPPVGTVYDIRTIGTTRFGGMDISMPAANGGTVSKRYLITPFGYFPVPARHESAVNAESVTFYDPFVSETSV